MNTKFAKNQEKLVQQAIQWHQKGNRDKARRLYRKVLKADPDSVNALHFCGLLESQSGKLEKGIEMISRAIDLDPQYVDAYLNLGNILLAQQHISEAYACYRKAYELAPNRIEVMGNMGILLKHLGSPEEAEQLLRQVVERVPQWAEAHLNLSNCLYHARKFDQSLDSLRTAINLNPGLVEAYQRYAQLCYLTDNQEEAKQVYKKWLTAQPGNVTLIHINKAISGGDVPERASDEYIKAVFDSYAGRFEHHLSILEYSAPQFLEQELAKMFPDARSELDILDVGCGTGLCAGVLKPYGKKLSGIDLSEKMLEQAKTKGVYDELSCQSLVVFLAQHTDHYDLIVSMDTLVYFGALEAVFKNTATALRNKGSFIFTLERHEDTSDYRIHPTGRYSHSENYIQTLARDTGFELIELRRCSTRKEANQEADGWLGIATKSDN